MPESAATDIRGTATVEQVGMVLLIGMAFALMVAFLLAGPKDPPGHGLGIRIANRIACGPREPGVCRRHPAVSAYGWSVARAVRWLAPAATARTGAGGTLLVPVDFRYCQRPSCAVPVGDGKLTTANRRLTLFTRFAGCRQLAARLAAGKSPTGSTVPRSAGSGSSAGPGRSNWRQPRGPVCCWRTARGWCRWKFFPAETTTSCRRATRHLGAGR